MKIEGCFNSRYYGRSLCFQERIVKALKRRCGTGSGQGSGSLSDAHP